MHRRDLSVPPLEQTILDLAEAAGRDVVTIGKIDDIFAHRGTGRNMRGDGNAALFDVTLEGLSSLADHTREQVPILALAAKSTTPIGRRAGFADIGATVARHLDLPAPLHGAHF